MPLNWSSQICAGTLTGGPFWFLIQPLFPFRTFLNNSGWPRDITAYKKGLMLARQAAQPSCQLRWCGGGALGQKKPARLALPGVAVVAGEAAHFVQIVPFLPQQNPFQPSSPFLLFCGSVPPPP